MKTDSQILAAKLLAQLLSEEQPKDNGREDAALSKVLARLEEMNSRLVQIETRLDSGNQENSPTAAPFTTFPISLHPSREKFALDEASGNHAAQKICHFEPGGKPCDYCSMCSSRGF